MSADWPRRWLGCGWLALLLAPLVLGVPACRHLEREPTAVRSSPPAEAVRRYRPRSPLLGFELLATGEEGRHYRVYSFRVASYSDRQRDFHWIEGRFYRALRPSRPNQEAPLLQISPILAGAADNYLLCRIFAGWAAQRGISAFYVYQEEDILEDDRDVAALQALLEENIQDTLGALDLLSRLDCIDGSRLGSLGISMGAIKNVALIAVEPRLRANGLFLGGADLAAILATSKERRVVRYVEKRCRREGVLPGEVSAELGRLPAEPTRFAPAIDSSRTFLFLGGLDNKVPIATGELLRELLGKPETYIALLGHYTGILAAPYAAATFFDYYEEQLARDASDLASDPCSDRS